MASSAAVESHLGGDEEEEDSEYEYEYEEIEVEEEFIEEIEVEVDEDDDSSIGEPLTPTPEENQQNGRRTPDKTSAGESGVKNAENMKCSAGEIVYVVGDHASIDKVRNAEIMKHSAREMVSAVGAHASFDEVKNTTNLKRSAGEMVSSVGVRASIERDDGVQYFKEETEEIAAEEAVDISKRSDPTNIYQKSLSPELNDGNKRAAIICDFFAKGWCIKGKSCRFLHVRDKVADTSQLKEGAAEQKSETPIVEVSSVATNSAWDVGARGKWTTEDGVLPSQRDDLGSINPLNDFGRDSFGRRSYLDHNGHYAPQLVKDSFPAYSNGSFRDSFPGNPLISSVRTQKHLESISSSSRRSSSPIPGSALGFHSRIDFSGGAQRPAEFKTNISCGNWEPSEPFRPSHPITQSLLSKANLYDPVRDGIAQTSSGGVFSQSSLYGQGASKDSTKLQEKVNMTSGGTLSTEDGSIKNILSSNFYDNKTGESLSEKNMSRTELEGVEIAVAPKEEKSSNSPHVQDFREADKINIDSESAIQKDISNHDTEPKTDRVRQKNHPNVDLKNDGNVQESKALKNFHVALVESVKELLRPTWHEGLLSRDAHKLIVKKTVDKVLGALQPNQIPNTSELVEQYLMVSQTKLTNLVEAYVEKYGKS